MLIDQLLYPVESLGPGKRVALWLVGCSRRCKGCANPELWVPGGQTPVSPEELFFAIGQIAKSGQIDGITITGGEPFEQAAELLCLVRLLRTLTNDIIIFSGYRHEQLLCLPFAAEIMEQLAVLVDGPYVEELNSALPLRGSSNQRILLFDKSLKAKYEAYLDTDERRVQNFHLDGQCVSVGIHAAGFKPELDNLLKTMDIRRASDERG